MNPSQDFLTGIQDPQNQSFGQRLQNYFIARNQRPQQPQTPWAQYDQSGQNQQYSPQNSFLRTASSIAPAIGGIARLFSL